ADIAYGTALSGTQLNATASVPGTFTYTPASGTVLSGGAGQTLHVDFAPTDTANYNTASKDVHINVNKADQTIDFGLGSQAGKTFGDPDFTISATSSSGLAVSFSVTAGPATILGTNTVHLTGAGLVTIQASQVGDGNYNAAPNVSQSFMVAKATPIIT